MLNKLEIDILKFINVRTWNKDNPKETKYAKNTGRTKVRWTNIRYSVGRQKRFTENNNSFNNAIANLKSKNLITSKTKCKLFAGLTCTTEGHQIIQNLIKK